MDSSSLRRTVSNEYAPTPPPPPPVFNIPTSPYTWVKPASTNVTRIPARKSDMERERERQRDYKLVPRSSMVSNSVVKIFYAKFLQFVVNFIFIIFYLFVDQDCFASLQGRLEFWDKIKVDF